jgi:hypothetical protein
MFEFQLESIRGSLDQSGSIRGRDFGTHAQRWGAVLVVKSSFSIAWFASRRTALRTIATLIVASACLSGVSSAQAGLFDDLFGVSGAPDFPSAEIHGRHMPSRRGHTTLKTHVRAHEPVEAPPAAGVASAGEGAAPKRAEFCAWGDRAAKPIDRTEALMRDATLRRGDVIVTDKGVRVFAGRAACPHTVADFQALAQARALPRGERTVLVAIERATKTRSFGRTEDPIVATDPANRADR